MPPPPPLPDHNPCRKSARPPTTGLTQSPPTGHGIMHTHCTIHIYCAVVAVRTLILHRKFIMNQLFPAVALNFCSPHPNTVQQHSIRVRMATAGHNRQLTATSGRPISQRNATVTESHQTGFTSRRQTVKKL